MGVASIEMWVELASVHRWRVEKVGVAIYLVELL